MLRLYAPAYLQIARIYEEYCSSVSSLAAGRNALPTDAQLRIVMDNLITARDICNRMHLFVSARSMDRTIEEFTNKRPTFAVSQQRFQEWYACFSSEVEGQVYLLVLPHRVSYWTSEADNLQGLEIKQLVTCLTHFPGASFDVTEAGNCFAFERFTACVYHLMRVAEFGLVKALLRRSWC